MKIAWIGFWVAVVVILWIIFGGAEADALSRCMERMSADVCRHTLGG